MPRRYVTVDVFTERVFGGNPLAVVLDAEGLAKPQMQAIANEFNYSETTFIFPPRAPGLSARVRLFTPRIEIPFAGHPNVGTAVALALDLAAKGQAVPENFVFEEAAGLVPVRLLKSGHSVIGAEITAPEALSVGSSIAVQDAADCVSRPVTDVVTSVHPPQVVSVGLPFLALELNSREALRQARPNWGAHERVLPPIGTDGVFAYSRDARDGQLHARVFAPLDATIEDPATGSAAAATISLLAQLRPAQAEVCEWRIEQGVDMGRPSLILGRTDKRFGRVTAVHIAGTAVPVMRGELIAEPT